MIFLLQHADVSLFLLQCDDINSFYRLLMLISGLVLRKSSSVLIFVCYCEFIHLCVEKSDSPDLKQRKCLRRPMTST